MIILDTHIWIWWVDNNSRLTQQHREWIQEYQFQCLGISKISCWEVAKLIEVGRLTLSISVEEWLEGALAYPGVQLLDLTIPIVVESTKLTGFHRDLADQIIVATARIYGCPLLTADAKILAYPDVQTLQTGENAASAQATIKSPADAIRDSSATLEEAEAAPFIFNSVNLYLGYTALIAGAVGGLSLISQQELPHQEPPQQPQVQFESLVIVVFVIFVISILTLVGVDQFSRDRNKRLAIDLYLEVLKNFADVEAIAKAHVLIKNWLSRLTSSKLEHRASSLLNSFSGISEDVSAALSQESRYKQRLALNSVANSLDQLVRELSNSRQYRKNHFCSIAKSWRQIVGKQVDKLAEDLKLRHEIDCPYIIGVPLTEQQEIFVGRTDISLHIEELLLDRRRPPLLLYGQRRMGKTSLLNNLGRLLPNSIIPLFVDFQGSASRANNHAGFLYNLARGMVESAKRQADLTLPSLTREALAADPFTCFDEWLDEVEQALDSNTALLALDEFEVLDKALTEGRFSETDVLGMLRNLIQHRPRFKVLLSGSHTIEEFQRWASYLINVQVVHISYLKETEARQLIERPVKDFTLRYEADALERVLQLTRCHPFLVQLLCAEIVALKNEQDPSVRRLASLADVEEAVPDALSSGSFFFADIQSNQVDAAGLELLHFLAAKGEGATFSKKVLSRQFPDGLNSTLDLLLRRELIEQISDGYRFQVELIRRWFAKVR